MVSCRHINPSKEHPERIKKINILLSILLIHKKIHKKIKSLLVILIMMELGFLFKKKILARLKKRTIYVLMFGYENGLVFPIYLLDQKFELHEFVAFK